MLKKYIGKNRVENLDWLLNVWLTGGPTVCFLQGFSGVGKTDLARDFRNLADKQLMPGNKPKWQQAVMNEIADRATPSVLENLMELSVKLSRQGLPEMERILFEHKNPDLAYALEKALESPVVIILDEAQRFFRGDTGAPLPEMNHILSHLRNRQQLPGRLLLLSDRIVEESRWSEWIPKRTLTKLEPDEAVETLETKLAESGLAVDIPPERKKEVVRDLDFNPRAIEALVSALRYETLDEIIGSNPGLWAMHDREVSREFLKALEIDLLERTLRHLSEVHQRRLWRLAVHRRSFKREAVEKLCGTKDEANELRSILVTRYLLNFYKGNLSLNPIVREISISHLRDESVEFKQAHSKAADYHLRHFKAEQIVARQTRLGESFAELRYHLVMAGRERELSAIGQRFTDHLKQELKSVSPVPKDREELDERIGVLTALLENTGAKGLEYHLAKCLEARNKPGDLASAVIHAQRATGRGAPCDSWLLSARLLDQAEGVEPAMAVIEKAMQEVSVDDKLFAIYQLGAEILSGANKSEEAINLLKEGINIIPPDKNLYSLYQISAEILAKLGKTDEAVELLKGGIKVIPPDKSLFSLYQILGEIYCRAGQVRDAIATQREGFQRISWRFGGYKLAEGALFLCAASDDALTIVEILSGAGASAVPPQQIALGKVLQCQMRSDWQAATEAAGSARKQFPRYFCLACLEAFSRLAGGDAESAWRVLSSFPNLTFGVGDPHGWLAVLIHLRRGARLEASAKLAIYLGRPVDEIGELNERFLFRLWDQQESAPENHRLCFYFPILPPSLTGLSQMVRRVQFGKPVLPELIAAAPGGNLAGPPVVASDEPEVYVSYAWGDDTPEGIKREEIVNQMCDAVARTGRIVGRDNTVLKPGDSIEAFADKIARAHRIVAVVSKKSLYSKFCMVDEIFSAYQRSGFRRTEFQAKVIALVMDDATELLNNDITLVKHWRAVYENELDGLKSVDPHNKALERWGKVHKLGDMCDHLLNMLDAIKDVIMPRGYEDIVKGNFDEVIGRLPPKRT